MTRKEALAKLNGMQFGWSTQGDDTLVDALVALGVLHLETTEDKVRVAAAERLKNMRINVHAYWQSDTSDDQTARITLDGAFEILDILTKSGFRITRDET